MAGHRLVHLLGAADVELLGLELHPRRVVERLARVDAEQDVVARRRPRGSGNGRRWWRRSAGPSAGRCRSHRRAVPLDGDAVVLDLDEEVLLAEDLLVPGAEPLRLGRLAVQDVVGELGGGAAGEADQPFGVALEDLLVDPGLVVEAFEERERREPHEVPEPCGVPARSVRWKACSCPEPPPGFVGPPPGRDVGLQPDDRLDAGAFASRRNSTAP